MRETKVAIIGGGPAGLYAASSLEVAHIPYLLIEASSTLGGQSMTLYPEKEVVDVKIFPPLKAKEIINAFVSALNPQNILLNNSVLSYHKDGATFLLKGSKEDVKANYIIVATGLGFHKPRTMGLIDEDKCSNIFYSLLDPSLMKDKRVAIFGGGDSALDWAKGLSSVAKDVYLVHRRTEFRGNPETIKGCKMNLYLPYIPVKLTQKDGKCVDITIQNVADQKEVILPIDYVLVNFGQVPSLATFSLPLTKTGFGILTDDHYEAEPGVYVAGDCLYDVNKKKRIEPAIEEVDIILSCLKKNLD
jgi:thioredoxin reductase